MKKQSFDSLVTKCKITPMAALNLTPKEFVNEYLFPFMRREAGHGFGMEYWRIGVTRPNVIIDEVSHKVPFCGSAMCIGGTMDFLLGTDNMRVLAAVLGLTFRDTDALFYNWRFSFMCNSWPKDLSDAFLAANTPGKKERVAEAVVLRALETGGRCFQDKETK